MNRRTKNKNKRTLASDVNIDNPKKMLKTSIPSKQLSNSFYNLSSHILAQNLLGKLLVRKIDSVLCKGRIVETECYPGGDDRASATFNGKRTAATEALYMDPGSLFVYMTYGMYYCMNISSSEPGGGVLIRALEPLEGIKHMKKWRIDKTKSKKEISTENLCNGPSKLCTSLQITKKDCNMLNIASNEFMWIEDDPSFAVKQVVETTRIGINSVAKEWREKPYRFYILGNNCVSKKDALKEGEMYKEIK